MVAVKPVCVGFVVLYVTVYVPTGKLLVVECESVTVELPFEEHAEVAAILLVFGLAVIVTEAVLFALRATLQPLLENCKLVIVIPAVPVDVSPVAMNVPDPAVDTVMVAVFAVCVGFVVL